jgi:prepilin-type processing-associated H-X9-DG protein/prepilin-type N-terminal cleavage/methylation domain-containing protein
MKNAFSGNPQKPHGSHGSHGQVNASRPAAAFTLLELLVTVSIICILAVLLFPLVQTLSNSAKSSKCLSNMRNISSAFLTQIVDYDGRLPSQGQNGTCDWPYLVSPGGRFPWEIDDSTLFLCPFDKTGGVRTYSLNGSLYNWDPNSRIYVGKSLASIRKPATTFLLFESPSASVATIFTGNYGSGGPDGQLSTGGAWLHGKRGSNFAYLDGHVAFIPTPVKPDTAWFPSVSNRNTTFGTWMAGWGVEGWDNF